MRGCLQNISATEGGGEDSDIALADQGGRKGVANAKIDCQRRYGGSGK